MAKNRQRAHGGLYFSLNGRKVILILVFFPKNGGICGIQTSSTVASVYILTWIPETGFSISALVQFMKAVSQVCLAEELCGEYFQYLIVPRKRFL